MFRTLLVALLFISPACAKDGKEKPAKEAQSKDKLSKARPTQDTPASEASTLVAASAPIANLGDVVATLQLPSGNSPGALAKIVDNVQPGASAGLAAQIPMLLAQVSGVDLAGADLSAPVSLVVLNPKKVAQPFVLLVKARDSAALKASAEKAGRSVVSQNGLSLIGSPAAVKSAQSFAFAHLARPSAELIGTVYPGPLARAYKGDVDRAIAEMSETMRGVGMGPALQTMMEIYREMLDGLGEQTDRATIRLGSAGSSSELYISLYPKSGTTMAAFTAAQIPAPHQLLGKLPTSRAPTALFSGQMHAGTAMDVMTEFGARAMMLVIGKDKGAELAKLLSSWLAAFDGRVAMVMDMKLAQGAPPIIKARYLMGSSDADAMRKGWRGMMRLMSRDTKTGKPTEMMGMKFDIDFKEQATEIDGVEVDFYSSKMDLSSFDAPMREAMKAANVDQKMYFAVFDKFAAMSMASDSPAEMKELIDCARGKAPGYKPGPGFATALGRSKERKESMLFAMDVAAIAPPGAPIPFQLVAMGLGRQDGALVLRVALGK